MSNPYAPPSGDGPAERPQGEQPPPPTRPEARGWSPSSRVPQPPPDPEVAREATRPVFTVATLMFATLLAAALPLPWQLGALGFGLATVVLGIRAIRRLVRAGLGRSPLVVMLAGGLAFTSLTLFGIGSTMVLWSVQMEHQRCLGDALTISAKEACAQTYQDALTSRLPSWSSLLTPASGG